ncbi:FAD/NAD(P)-binding domain-containing protein [Xylariomycetidae sp. FL0641]|nr:FAD/NAD(P)-binding domain-containing protein [Xylariomycetidae sp. FL0641]
MPSNEKQLSPNRRIAIIGGGISGIACAWKLRDSSFELDIIEQDDRLGGHANSVPFEGNGGKVNVDTGFIVMNETTYPQFHTFLTELGVETISTDMAFGVATYDGTLEWGSSSISSFIGCLSNLFSFAFWRLMFDIIRFSLFASDILYEDHISHPLDQHTELKTDSEALADREISEVPHFETIGEWLRRQGYSEQFITYFLIPMTAAPWCIGEEEFARTFPARPLIKFMSDHCLLNAPFRRLKWRAFPNGSKAYIDAFRKGLPPHHQVHLSTRVQQLRRIPGGVELEMADGSSRVYDHVVLAVHANQALRLLGNEATVLERKILSCFKTTRNVCYLHSDTSLLPRRVSARVAWNCIIKQPTSPSSKRALHPKSAPHEDTEGKISITFDMNKLQGIAWPGVPCSPGRVLVSMNPPRLPARCQSSQVYFHPLIDSRSTSTVPQLNRINGIDAISFAGAWMGFGFHEDGFAAGTYAARMLLEGREAVGELNLITGTALEPRRTPDFWEGLARMVVMVIQWLLTCWEERFVQLSPRTQW